MVPPPSALGGVAWEGVGGQVSGVRHAIEGEKSCEGAPPIVQRLRSHTNTSH